MSDDDNPVALIVSGSRDGIPQAYVWKVLDRYAERVARPSVVIHGACRGVDTAAGEWARSRKINIDPHPVDWLDERGRVVKSRGPIRNEKMAKLGTHCLVIRHPSSNGSQDMEARARRHGLVLHAVVFRGGKGRAGG
jgi:hypothetical protein